MKPVTKKISKRTSSKTPAMTYEEALKKASRLEKKGLTLTKQLKKEIVRSISENLTRTL